MTAYPIPIFNVGNLLLMTAILGVVYLVALVAFYKQYPRLANYIGIFLSMTSIASWGLAMWQDDRQKSLSLITRAELADVGAAVANYLHDNPTTTNSIQPGLFDADNQELLMSPIFGSNSKATAYLYVPSNRINGGKYIDRWGKPYNVVIYFDHHENNSNLCVAAWSFGPGPVLLEKTFVEK